ncbi:uncharacterized protein LOC124308282 isoform X1 [Neodiprion virginianus]|uniref:uncharacterized protein LOC124308282 isoform X1 n=2 Tax=Neodiprion virginianus TaxID=2961670 RepID=UPI001EE7808B|nr:uncharacterized protein LOC124308282 isoform X1 [Neodiprion virginianus]XP_046626844.1 uncharacterized protein LOC124308282 isoform X1 [Neodiprion virginianus]
MSAESPRRGIHKGAQVVSPQPVSDRSIIESVAGIINDIVPQAYTGTPTVDNKESITWARFEYADVNDPILYPDYNEGSSTPPLLLVLGYGTGVQVWLITASGEATEVLSWRQGVVRTLRFLPNPKGSNEQSDLFYSKRPLVSICDSAGPGPQFCNIGFISLKTGEQVKSIKFKNPVNDVLANRRTVIVTFSEKIAVFDAKNLEDILTVTTCYLSPGPNSNPVALGTRWLAYSEKKLIPARRSSGGSEGEGTQSYTATVLHAAKSLGKGLRGLGETVASTLTGNSVPPSTPNSVGFDTTQPGVVTILDLQAAKEDKELDDGTVETVLAHFTAHSDAIVAMTFDLTGALLMTADRRGHDFHIFRIQPHPGGPTLAAVHHLYVLHRGDTTAKVQDMTFSSDARWAAVSTVRGTTHVFPVAPYGGPVGVRTHSTPHVVNRLSRFHRSAGLTADGTRSHSPVAHAEIPVSVYPYSNPRLPPYPHPTILHPLAQIRQPSTLNHVNNQPLPRPQQRQRLQSEDSGSLPLKICCCFAPQRAWLYAQRDAGNKVIKRSVDSLFIMACHGNMIQYDLEPKPAAGIPKEKVCDDTTIELDVEAKGQWPLLRSTSSLEILPPLPGSSLLLSIPVTPKCKPATESIEDQWLSQVEIVTHAGPHRRLWMGPQFIFKTYNAPSGVAVNLVEAEAVEVGVTAGSRPARSNPVNMPHTTTRPLVPVVIDGSGSSYEQSPRFLETYEDSLENDTVSVGGGENQLREDLAEAMLETATTPHRVPGRRVVVERMGQPVTKVVNPLGTVITISADEEDIVSSDNYEMDNNLEPLRSLCAQEGPASLDDFKQESQPVKNLTEICAEMRTTSDSALDSLASQDIKEVVEQKALYAEAMKLRSKDTVNFDEAGTFSDVQMTLNLCAEAGQIPASPMTQAKENPWNQRSTSARWKLQETQIARAKYVVNYDEDTVVFTDNKETVTERTRNNEETSEESDHVQNPLCTSKYSNNPILDNTVREQTKCVTSKNSGEGQINTKELKNFSLHTGTSSFDLTSIKDQKEYKDKKSKQRNESENKSCLALQSNQQDETNKVNVSTAKGIQKSLPIKEKFSKKKNRNKHKDVDRFESSFETIKDSEIHAITLPATDSTSVNEFGSCANDKLCQSDSGTSRQNHTVEKSFSDQVLHINDVSEYSILEKNEYKDGVSSNHSDEDLEHIDTSEVTLDLAFQIMPSKIQDFETANNPGKSPTTKCNDLLTKRERNSSKATSSDDDMEHIHSSEISEDYSRRVQQKHQFDTTGTGSDAECIKLGKSRKAIAHQSATSPRVCEDGTCSEGNYVTLETDVHKRSEITIEDECAGQQVFLRNEADRIYPKVLAKVLDAEEVVESNPDVNKGKERVKTTKNRKKKDDVLVVVVSNTVEKNETALDECPDDYVSSKRNKPPGNVVTEDMDGCVDKATGAPAPSRRFAHRDGKLMSNEATSLSNIEIIDIDALRRAEARCEIDASHVSSGDCRVSEFRPEILLGRPKKSRKLKKITHCDTSGDGALNPSPLSLSKLKLLETEIQQHEPPEISSAAQSEERNPASSWSSVVKKSRDKLSSGICERSGDAEKEIDLESKMLQRMEPISINQPTFPGDRLKNVNKTFDEDNETEECPKPILTPGNEVNEILDGCRRYTAVQDDRLQKCKDTRVHRDIKDQVREKVNESMELEFSDSVPFLSTREKDTLKCDYPAQSLDCDQNLAEDSELSLLFDSEDKSYIISKSESVATLVQAGEHSSSSGRSSKEPSPEAEVSPSKENDIDPEPAAVDSLNLSDDTNVNSNMMDTEEENSSKENIDKGPGNGCTTAKKGRSKKKRRR